MKAGAAVFGRWAGWLLAALMVLSSAVATYAEVAHMGGAGPVARAAAGCPFVADRKAPAATAMSPAVHHSRSHSAPAAECCHALSPAMPTAVERIAMPAAYAVLLRPVSDARAPGTDLPGLERPPRLAA